MLDQTNNAHTLPQNTLVTAFQALQLETYDAASGETVWKLAEVRANNPGKGRGMNKKQKEARFNIPLASVSRIRVFVDF